MASASRALITPLVVDGKELQAAAVNEQQVRVAAGITMAVGAIAFVYAHFDKLFWPIRTVSAFFFVDFLLRVAAGLEHSPTGLVAGWLTRRQPPRWVSAKPKRFAWSLGAAMALAMTVVTNSSIHGALPRTICLICLTLMWLEAVLGLCVGCELYAVLVRRGWRHEDPAVEVCANGACDVDVTAAAPDVGDVLEGTFTATLDQVSGTMLKQVTGGSFRVPRIGGQP